MQTKSLNGTIIRSVPFVDHFAIGVSALCIAHCLLLPILLVALPVLGQSFLGSETLHVLLVYAVIPSSLFALSVGCSQHKKKSFMLLGILGMIFLVLGISVEILGMDHDWEQRFTLAGALMIAFAHVRNFQKCREANAHNNCKCD